MPKKNHRGEKQNMPRVFIREIDSTTAGTVTSANFSVVVPGFCGNELTKDEKTGKWTRTDSEGNVVEVTDENGVYECGSQSDFRTNIGLKGAKTAGEAAAKSATLMKKAGKD